MITAWGNNQTLNGGVTASDNPGSSVVAEVTSEMIGVIIKR